MHRRNFIASSVAASYFAAANPMNNLAASTQNTAAAQNIAPKPEFYELRLYHLRFNAEQKQNIINDYFGKVVVPAMNRSGIPAVGAFNVMIGPNSPTLYMLVPHKSLDSFTMLAAKLAADAEYQKAGAAFHSQPVADPAYTRIESSLMVAFAGMPKLEVPAKKPRIFELRTYESPNERAAKKKIEMFDIGEIAIFRRTGLQPVFFGETLIGPKMPNLTYMLTYDDMTARDKNWASFIADPEWKKLSSTPGFTNAEILTNISSVFLRPTAYSQI